MPLYVNCRSVMSILLDTLMDLRMLGPEAQRLHGCYGHVTQSTSLAGDASAGSFELALLEEDSKPNIYRCFKIRTISITQAGAAADAAMTLEIRGKGIGQQDRVTIPGTLKVAVGGFDGPWHALDAGLLAPAFETWFVPNPEVGTQRLRIGVSYANPTATVTVTLRVALLWDFYKPWR